jgi:hypothetical protein
LSTIPSRLFPVSSNTSVRIWKTPPQNHSRPTISSGTKLKLLSHCIWPCKELMQRLPAENYLLKLLTTGLQIFCSLFVFLHRGKVTTERKEEEKGKKTGRRSLAGFLRDVASTGWTVVDNRFWGRPHWCHVANRSSNDRGVEDGMITLVSYQQISGRGEKWGVMWVRELGWIGLDWISQKLRGLCGDSEGSEMDAARVL